MGSTTDKAKGLTNEAVGQTKQRYGQGGRVGQA